MKCLRFKLTPVSLLAALIFLPFSAFAQQTNTLETYKTALQRQEHGLLAQYGNTLETLMTSFKQKGDLETFLVVDNEKKRFDEEQTVFMPAEAKDAFRPAVEAYNKASVDLLKKYVAALDGLVKKLVMSDSIEEAKEAKAERDRALAQLKTAEEMLPKVEQEIQSRTSFQPSSLPKSLDLIGSFHVIVDDDAIIFLNGKRIFTGHIGGSISETVRLKVNDCIIVNLINSGGGPRYFGMAFFVSDRRRVINFRKEDYRILSAPPEKPILKGLSSPATRKAAQETISSVTPAAFTELTQIPTEATTGRFQDQIGFPTSSDWVWGTFDNCWLVSIITPEMIAVLNRANSR
jgi:hypothetical protein